MTARTAALVATLTRPQRQPRRDRRYIVVGVAIWLVLTLLTPLARALASYGW